MSINFNSPARDTSEEMDIDESFRYLNFLLMWYRNRSSVNLANMIVAELEALNRRVKEIGDEPGNRECERVFVRAMRLFSAARGYEVNWPGVRER